MSERDEEIQTWLDAVFSQPDLDPPGVISSNIRYDSVIDDLAEHGEALTRESAELAMEQVRKSGEERIRRISDALEKFDKSVHPLMRDDELVRVWRATIAGDILVHPAQAARIRDEYIRRLNAKLEAQGPTPLDEHQSEARRAMSRWN